MNRYVNGVSFAKQVETYPNSSNLCHHESDNLKITHHHTNNKISSTAVISTVTHFHIDKQFNLFPMASDTHTQRTLCGDFRHMAAIG